MPQEQISSTGINARESVLVSTEPAILRISTPETIAAEPSVSQETSQIPQNTIITKGAGETIIQSSNPEQNKPFEQRIHTEVEPLITRGNLSGAISELNEIVQEAQSGTQ